MRRVMSNCEKYEQAMSAYADGELSSEESRALKEHLAGCADCRSKAQAWQQTSQALREVPAVTAQRWEALWERVEEKGRREATSWQMWKSVWRAAAVTAAAAAVLLAAHLFVPADWGAVERGGAGTSGDFEVVSIEVGSPDYDVFVMATKDDELPVIWLEEI